MTHIHYYPELPDETRRDCIVEFGMAPNEPYVARYNTDMERWDFPFGLPFASGVPSNYVKKWAYIDEIFMKESQ